MNRESRELFVFHEKEVEALLRKLGLLTKFRNGRLSCVKCGKRLTYVNFGGLLKRKDKILFVCDEVECLGGVSEPVRT